jgi:16S rRNA (uracil1498-N3)-methyltransferase
MLLIGPEGDFAPSEIEAAIAKEFMPIDLGPTRLRTETAGIFALSCLKNF